MNRYEWNNRMLEVLESTFAYDAAMTELLLPDSAKRFTTPQEQNENYLARLTRFQGEQKEVTA